MKRRVFYLLPRRRYSLRRRRMVWVWLRPIFMQGPSRRARKLTTAQCHCHLTAPSRRREHKRNK